MEATDPTIQRLIVEAVLPEMTDEAFRLWAYEEVHEAGRRNANELGAWCDSSLHSHGVRHGGPEDYGGLGAAGTGRASGTDTNGNWDAR